MSFTHIHTPYHLLRMKEMGIIYWCHSFGAIGISLAMIFVPIFLLKSGYSFTEVMLYLLAKECFALFLQLPVARMSTYLRPNTQLAFGNIWYILFFGLLLTLDEYNWPLYLLALVFALNRSIYWTAYHYCFGQARAHKKSSRQIAGMNAIIIVATTIAPALGGIIATYWGMHYVYMAAIVFLIIAAAPALLPWHGPKRPKLHMSWRIFKRIKRDVAANTFNGAVGAAEISIWPLFVYLLVTSYAGVGLLSSVIAIASIAVTLYVGRREEVRGERYFIRRGIATQLITNIGRSLAQNTMHIFGLNLLGGIGRSLYITPYMNRYYANSDGRYRLGYVSTLEAAHSVGAALYFIALLILLLFMPVKVVLSTGLIIVAVAVIGLRLMR